jgi:hypothetical protein
MLRCLMSPIFRSTVLNQKVRRAGGPWKLLGLLMALFGSADRIELRLSSEAKRKTSTRDEYFAFLANSDVAGRRPSFRLFPRPSLTGCTDAG